MDIIFNTMNPMNGNVSIPHKNMCGGHVKKTRRVKLKKRLKIKKKTYKKKRRKTS